jgi:hypothetical protein
MSRAYLSKASIRLIVHVQNNAITYILAFCTCIKLANKKGNIVYSTMLPSSIYLHPITTFDYLA